MLSFIFSLDFLWWLILLLYVPACFALIVIVLLQKGKGVGFAGAFGMGGGSDTVFGPRSVKSLPQKLTYTAAGVFMFLALVLSLLSPHVGKGVAPEEEDEQVYMSGTAMDELMGTESSAPASESAPEPESAPAVTVATESETPGTAEEAPAEAAPAPEEAPAAAPAEPEEQAPEAAPAPAAETPADAETPAAQ